MGKGTFYVRSESLGDGGSAFKSRSYRNNNKLRSHQTGQIGQSLLRERDYVCCFLSSEIPFESSVRDGLTPPRYSDIDCGRPGQFRLGDVCVRPSSG